MNRLIRSLTGSRRSPASPRSAAALVDAAGAPRAFTLIEVLVAVGVVALVAVGLAAVFDSIGKTVSGGRRVSVLNTYASLVEEQFRRDFAGMTREAPLMIRNQLRGGGLGFRADEVVFFAKGDFTSKRRPIAPDMLAKSNVARIYYGHGERADPLDDNTFIQPQPSWGLGRNGPTAPPVFLDAEAPQDRMLLRHATLLVQPGAAGSTSGREAVPGLGVPADDANGNAERSLEDQQTQIAGQPAVASIFRSWRVLESSRVGSIDPIRGTGQINDFATGVVDIATSDLAEIRRHVNGGGASVNAGGGSRTLFPSMLLSELARNGRGVSSPSFVQAPRVGRYEKFLRGFGFRPFLLDPDNPQVGAVDAMHAWMDDLWPTNAKLNPFELTPDFDIQGIFTFEGDSPRRIRYEPEAPGLLDLLANQPIDASYAVPNTIDASLRQQMALTDQIAVTSNNFVPHCSEFIVEWSFGRATGQGPLDPLGSPDGILRGETVWHGMTRVENLQTFQALPYPYRPNAVPQPDTQPYLGAFPSATPNPNFGVAVDLFSGLPIEEYVEFDFIPYKRGSPAELTDRNHDARDPRLNVYQTNRNGSGRILDSDSRFYPTPERRRHPITARLIHGYDVFPFADQQQRELTSYFGYVDPTFDPSDPIPGGPRIPGGAQAQGFEGIATGVQGDADGLLPCPWPRMIRITMTISDPKVGRSETFQFVFDLPESLNR